MSQLETRNASEILDENYLPVQFIIQRFLPEGLHILAGPPKVGKSWMSLYFCTQIATGEPVWGMKTAQGTALYLCLEDNYNRIQQRLLDSTDEAPENLYFAICADQLGSGLEEQIEDFLRIHVKVRLIVIDTLQKIRPYHQADHSYANDYDDLNRLKKIAEQNHIAILLVHHLRKQPDIDPINMISGTTGLSGCADGNYVLCQMKQTQNAAKLYVIGRDIPRREMELLFDNETYRWRVTRDSYEAAPPDPLLLDLEKTMEIKHFFSGTATELSAWIAEKTGTKYKPAVLVKRLMKIRLELAEAGFRMTRERQRNKRTIELIYTKPKSDVDDETPKSENEMD